MDFTDDPTASGGVTETVETEEDHFEVPPPEIAEPEDVERYNLEFAKERGLTPDFSRRGRADPEEAPFAKRDNSDEVARNAKHRARFPWLSDPSRGARWDFDPIALRNLAQTNTWVGMLVQSITKEIAETPWTIVEADGRTETQKRLQTHPEERTPIAKADGVTELPDANAERIHDLLTRPNPDLTWQDMVEMWMGDLLEIGSTATVKAFHRSAYGSGDDGSEELAADPSSVVPRALQPTAPEVWTKEFHNRTGLIDGYWQFDDHRAPGSGTTEDATTRARGGGSPDFFAPAELVWSDMTPRTNRRYGIPPTLLVEDFLQSLDLAVVQEQQYLSRGSIPSGAWVFEQWDRAQLRERRQEMEENVKGKPHKSLMFAGQGGDVSFEPMSMNFEELQFTERMKWYARVVASAFQVPTAVVGIEPERVNYNTFQGERENFESNTLGPYLQKLERMINHELIHPHWGVGSYRFEFKPGMSESTRAMISERVTREFNAGIRRRNEARREIGLDEVDEDDDGFKSDLTDENSQQTAESEPSLFSRQSLGNRDSSLLKQEIPDSAYSIDDPAECSGRVVEGPRGGTYCVPNSEGDGTDETIDANLPEDDDAPDAVDVSNPTAVTDLSESEVDGGRNADDMRIVETADGRNVFMTEIDQETAERSVAASDAMSAAGANTPEHYYYGESGELAVEGIDGQTAAEVNDVDEESLLNNVAIAVALGNIDMNPSNIIVDDEGEAHIIDTEDTAVLFKADQNAKEAVEFALPTLEQHGIERSEFVERLHETAQEIQYDDGYYEAPDGSSTVVDWFAELPPEDIMSEVGL